MAKTNTSKSTRRRQRRVAADRRRNRTKAAPPEVVEEVVEEVEEYDEFADEVPEEVEEDALPELPPIDKMRDEMGPDDLLALVQCDDNKQIAVPEVDDDTPPVDAPILTRMTYAAEVAVLGFVVSLTKQGLWFTELPVVTVYNKEGLQLGPFPMDVDLIIDAKYLQGSVQVQ